MADQLVTCQYPHVKPTTGYRYGCRCSRCRHHARVAKNQQKRDRRIGLKHTVRRPRVDKDGYVRWNGFQGHPLAQPANGQIMAHRWTFYWKVDGVLPSGCEICETPFSSWSDVSVDHQDHDKLNNDPANLRGLCNLCNSSHQPHQYRLVALESEIDRLSEEDYVELLRRIKR